MYNKRIIYVSVAVLLVVASGIAGYQIGLNKTENPVDSSEIESLKALKAEIGEALLFPWRAGISGTVLGVNVAERAITVETTTTTGNTTAYTFNLPSQDDVRIEKVIYTDETGAGSRDMLLEEIKEGDTVDMLLRYTDTENRLDFQVMYIGITTDLDV